MTLDASPKHATRKRASLDLLTRTKSIPPSAEATPCDETLCVAWLGPGQEWCEASDTKAALDGVELSFSSQADRSLTGARDLPDVFHVIGSTRVATARLRSAAPETAIVLDLRHRPTGGRRFHRLVVRQSPAADLVVLDSRLALREARRRLPQLAERFVHLDNPLDLRMHAPREDLRKRGSSLDHFLERKSLAGHVVLYAGPFAARGGLDAAVSAIATVRSEASIKDLVLVAILEGEVDRRYLKRCLKEAARLGVPAIVEEAPSPNELPLWYAAADVVCLPSRDGAGGEPARLAAAAARPVVGSEVDSLLERVIDEETGRLVPVDDHLALTASVADLLTDEREAGRLGAAGRQQVEAEASPWIVATRLRRFWDNAVQRRRGGGGAVGGAR
jgi:glycosyltransferase involved in cell wall biosynthesis